jgi:two-component system OmpR family sensor kinase
MARATSHSLRRRLLGSVMAAIVLAAVFQAASAYRGALRQADAIFDYHLQQMAFVLRGGPPLAVPLLEADGHQGVDTTIQIWGPDGTQLFQSRRLCLAGARRAGFLRPDA